jgi:Single cache domain 3
VAYCLCQFWADYTTDTSGFSFRQGQVPILGTPYITGYEPIMDGSGAQIGVFYVGYKK